MCIGIVLGIRECRDECDMVFVLEEFLRYKDRDRYTCEYIESNVISGGKENLWDLEEK